MAAEVDGHITQLLAQWSAGKPEALHELTPLVYAELRRLAERHLRRERPDHTLGRTALVHEAYLRLVNQKNVQWQDRTHFFCLASQLMRRILVDQARQRLAAKRGDGAAKVSLDELGPAAEHEGDEHAASFDIADPAAVGESQRVDVIAIDAALTRLEALDPQQARIVELRFFGGLSVPETAQALGISATTVKRDWAMAKAWLSRELTGAVNR